MMAHLLYLYYVAMGAAIWVSGVKDGKLDPNNPDKSIGMVGMKSAATIHTATGLFCRVKERFPGRTDVPPLQDPNLQAPDPDEAEEPAALV